MTWQEEEKFWILYRCYYNEQGQRKGQAMMNALRHVAPILYDMVSGTKADVFYVDTSQDIMRFRDTIGV